MTRNFQGGFRHRDFDRNFGHRDFDRDFRRRDFDHDFRRRDFDRGFGEFGGPLLGGFAGSLLGSALFPGYGYGGYPPYGYPPYGYPPYGYQPTDITVPINNENTLSNWISGCLACFHLSD